MVVGKLDRGLEVEGMLSDVTRTLEFAIEHIAERILGEYRCSRPARLSVIGPAASKLFASRGIDANSSPVIDCGTISQPRELDDPVGVEA